MKNFYLLLGVMHFTVITDVKTHHAINDATHRLIVYVTIT